MSETGTYWNNSGKYQEQYNKAWEQLVPAQGEAKDGWPEALRAISRIGYDYYNNGFCNLWQGWEDIDDYGDEVMVYKMDSYYEDLVYYLRGHIPPDLYRELTEWLPTQQGGCTWGRMGDGIIDVIIDHIMEGIIEDSLLEEELVS
jgi:hypothetical protein